MTVQKAKKKVVSKRVVLKKSKAPKRAGLFSKLKKVLKKVVKPVKKIKKLKKAVKPVKKLKRPVKPVKKAKVKAKAVKGHKTAATAKKSAVKTKAIKKPVKVQSNKPAAASKKAVKANPKKASLKPVQPEYVPVHKSVMMKEVLENLDLAKRKVVVDCTLGLGGHAKEMLGLMPKNGKLIGFDSDNDHLKLAKKTLKDFKENVVFVNANFSTLAENLEKLKIKGVDAILFDLGLASPHVDNGERGFSFLRKGPLDMRFNIADQLTAAEVINKYSEKELIRIFKDYGEEYRARKIAMAITLARKTRPFKSTLELADFIERLLGRQGHIHPATRIFQALRIEVNHELDVLVSALTQAVEVLKPGGRIVVISYHSLEDRIVKMFFKDNSRDWINLPNEMTTTHLIPKLKTITKKPMEPSEAEVKENSRSRSAKLRVAEKI